MSGLYIAADLSALGEAAGQLANGSGAQHGGATMPSFGHAGADAAAADFSQAAQRHAESLSDAGRRGAEVLRGYAVTFHEIGD